MQPKITMALIQVYTDFVSLGAHSQNCSGFSCAYSQFLKTEICDFLVSNNSADVLDSEGVESDEPVQLSGWCLVCNNPSVNINLHNCY